MNINILKAVQIYTTKKDFIIYTELTRHRKKFGINSKFLLTDVIKKELKTININL